ncbi:hypothetical protein F4859DRAFT_218384 [Xylaria cf. heliscus]|nr:hypothetical protein F4859DRAFT_218384 [Xylaria cf. heliscus]
MRGLYMGASVFALAGMANASMKRWTYPDCEQDNCYRAFINAQYTELAPSFCLEFLASTTTDAAVIPTPFANCAGDIHAVSSACSCITYTYTHTMTTSSSVVTTTSSIPVTTTTTSSESASTPSTTPSQVPSSTDVSSTTEVPSTTDLSSTTQSPSTTEPPSTSTLESSSSSSTPENSPSSPVSSPVFTYPTEAQPTESSSSGYWSMTTSTVYSTKVYTVTSCAPTVTDCPATSSAYVTTSLIPVTETVYPVYPSSYPVWTPGGALNTSNTLATSHGAAGPTASVPLSGGYPVPTAAAARAWINEFAIAAGGAIAIAFL